MGRSCPEWKREAIRAALAPGLTLKEIAARAGVSPGAVEYWLGVWGVRLSGRVRARVVAAYRPGMTVSELARVSGASTGYVCNLARALGWTLTTQFVRAARLREKILAAHRKGRKRADVAREVGCSSSVVTYALMSAGLVRSGFQDDAGKTVAQIAAERGCKESSIRTRATMSGLRVEDAEIAWDDDLPAARGKKAPWDAEYKKWIDERGLEGFRFPPAVWERYRACWQAHVDGKPDAFYSEPGTFGS